MPQLEISVLVRTSDELAAEATEASFYGNAATLFALLELAFNQENKDVELQRVAVQSPRPAYQWHKEEN